MFVEDSGVRGISYDYTKKRCFVASIVVFSPFSPNFDKHIFVEDNKEGEKLWITVLWTIC